MSIERVSSGLRLNELTSHAKEPVVLATQAAEAVEQPSCWRSFLGLEAPTSPGNPLTPAGRGGLFAHSAGAMSTGTLGSLAALTTSLAGLGCAIGFGVKGHEGDYSQHKLATLFLAVFIPLTTISALGSAAALVGLGSGSPLGNKAVPPAGAGTLPTHYNNAAV